MMFDNDDEDPVEESKPQPENMAAEEPQTEKPTKTIPPKQNEVLWEWKVRFSQRANSPITHTFIPFS